MRVPAAWDCWQWLLARTHQWSVGPRQWGQAHRLTKCNKDRIKQETEVNDCRNQSPSPGFQSGLERRDTLSPVWALKICRVSVSGAQSPPSRVHFSMKGYRQRGESVLLCTSGFNQPLLSKAGIEISITAGPRPPIRRESIFPAAASVLGHNDRLVRPRESN